MEKIEYTRKEFKLRQETIDKFVKLKSAYETENPEDTIFEKDVLVKAIDLLYSSKFGKDVFDETMGKLENVLGNRMKDILNEYTIRFASSLENIYLQILQIKEIQLLMLKSNDILPDSQREIQSLIMANQKLEDQIKEAVLFKQELNF